MREGRGGITVHRSGVGIYCHSYDLSKQMCDQFVGAPSSSLSSSSVSTSSWASNDNVDDDDSKQGPINPILGNAKIVDCSISGHYSSLSDSSSSTTTTTSVNIMPNRQNRGMVLFQRVYTNLLQPIQTHANTVI